MLGSGIFPRHPSVNWRWPGLLITSKWVCTSFSSRTSLTSKRNFTKSFRLVLVSRSPCLCAISTSEKKLYGTININYYFATLKRECRRQAARSRLGVASTQRYEQLRSSLSLILSILIALSSTLMTWKSLRVLTILAMPNVCVFSESMAAAFHRGNVLFIWNWNRTVQVGNVPVIWVERNHLPMVYRVQVIQVINNGDK